MKTTQVRIESQGGAEVMQLAEVELSAPGPGEVQLEQTAIGLNFMDVYQRSGAYKLALPATLGLEAAGRVIAVGPEVEGISVGDRVAYGGLLGAYGAHRNAPAARLVKIPDAVSDEAAAAVLMKGMTVEYLLERTYKVQPGQDVLFYAASGGVGQIAGPWGAHLGARMIGVTSGAENCAAAKANGYAEAIDRKTEDIAARVRELTDGKGVPVAYDSIGRATFDATIKSLATYGYFVCFGATSGPPPPVEASVLQNNGSLYFTRPTLADYVKARADLERSAARVFELLATGVITPQIGAKRPLSEVGEAHRALEAGETTGSTLFLP